MENNKSINILNKKGTYLGAFLVFAGALFFSGKAILVKMIYAEAPEVDHVALLALRMGFSLPFFLAIAFYKHQKSNEAQPISLKDWLSVLALGIGGYYVSSVLDFWGLEYVTASLERLILFTYPTLVVLISAMVLRKKITKVVFSALLVTYVGIVVVLLGEHIVINEHVMLGAVLVFMAAITYAIYLVGSERMIFKLGNIRYTSIVMSIACICVVFHFLAVHEVADLYISSSVIGKGACMALFCTVVPSFLIAQGIKIIGASSASIIASIGPICTLFLAWYFLGERIENIQILGTIIVVAGVALTSIYSKREAQ